MCTITHSCSCQETVQRDPDRSLYYRCLFSCTINTNDATMLENYLDNREQKTKHKSQPSFFSLEFFVPLENLSFGDDTIAGEGMQIFTYARHLSPMIMSSEGSLACQTYCDTGHPFCAGHLRGPVILTPNAEGLSAEISLPVLTIQGCRAWDSNIDPLAGRTLLHTAPPPRPAAFVITRQMSEGHRQTQHAISYLRCFSPDRVQLV